MAVKKVAQNPAVLAIGIAIRNSYKTLAKHCANYTVYLACQQSSTRKPQWFQNLKLAFLETPNVTTWLVFQNQVTNEAYHLHTRDTK